MSFAEVKMPKPVAAAPLVLLLSACAAPDGSGLAPDFTPPVMGPEHVAMMTPGLPFDIDPEPGRPEVQLASLWTGERGSLLGDNRAIRRGDILTVVIEIDDSAQIRNSSEQNRQGSQEMQVDALFGLPERTAGNGVSLTPGVQLGSSGSFSGSGGVTRNEQLTLRVAATVVDVLPNGVLSIAGQQEVRVNNELRELLVSGFVRPADISRQNEVTYDKIAAARISYGGRGQVSAVQAPRWGQQAVDAILPF